jgi:ABC-type spermidine/putrescine transport system permease subunit II
MKRESIGNDQEAGRRAGQGSAFARSLLATFAVLVFAYILLPLVIIVPMSVSAQSYFSFPPTHFSTRWYESVFARGDWWTAAVNSFVIGVPTAILATILGTIAALAVTRSGMKGMTIATAIILAPLMLPHVILALGLYPVMVKVGLLRTYGAAIIGHTVVALPLVFVTVSASLRSYAPTYEMAAMSLGANAWNAFFHVTFPMIRSGVYGGAILAFATSFDELMLSLFLTGARTRTLPRLIWEHMNDFLTPAIAAVAVLVLAFTLVLFGLAALVRRHRPGEARA